jgi:hypothetical protein
VLDRKEYNVPWLEKKLKDPRVEKAFLTYIDRRIDQAWQEEEGYNKMRKAELRSDDGWGF